jgi:hypothetical protein
MLPILIAETPNAGKCGHRFLASAGATIGDVTVSAFVSQARRVSHIVGGNYLAVRHKVTQRSTGRPDAGETLILVGIDTSKISDKKQTQIITILRSLLDKLDAVVQEIDWSQERRLVVPNSTLAEWLSEDIRSLPIADIQGGPQELVRTVVPTRTNLPQKRPWELGLHWLTVLVLILFLLSVTAVGLMIVMQPFRIGPSVIDTTDNRSQQDEKTNPKASNSLASDDFSARIEELRSEVSVAKDENCLVSIRTQLYDLELRPELTKDQQSQIVKLLKELAANLENIKKEQSHIRLKINRFFREIENSLSGENDQKTLESLLARLDQPPHPDQFTEDDREWQNKLRDIIKSKQTELSWKDFKEKFDQHLSNRNFKSAATHLLKWTNGKERARNELKDVYKAELQADVDKTVEREIQAANFSKIRQLIRERFSSPDVDEVVGNRFLQFAWDKIDDAEDMYRYERILSSPSVADEKERVEAYLNSPVARKRMKKTVEELKHYLDMANEETTISFSITSIYWGNHWTGKNTVELTVKTSEKIENNIRTIRRELIAQSDKSERIEPSINLEFKARPDSRISLNVQVSHSKNRNESTSSYNDDTTILKLHGLSDKILRLNDPNRIPESKESTVEIKFEVKGIPEKPELPPWSKD